MAQENPNSNKTDSFDRGMNQDTKDYHSRSSQWSFARNANNWAPDGANFDIGSEPSNLECIKAPYTIIGFIHLFSDNWIVFSTDDTHSEIGRFVEGTCTYTAIVDGTNPLNNCLNFNRANLIIGVSKENFDCSWHIYWADGVNPDRTMNVDAPAFNCIPVTTASCTVCTPNPALGINCDGIRLARLVNAPCIRVIKGASGGNLLNGSYFVVPAYKVNGQRVTDFFTPSNIQPLFEHSNVAGSIDVIIDSMDTRFDEFELVVVSVINQQTEAKSFGTYSTRQKTITIDIIDPKLPSVPLAWIPLHNPIADKSDAIYEVGNYLLRVSPTNKFDFNYQPLANQIVVKWQSVEYPADYYRKGGSNTSRLRDENYCEFIQWIYDDGDFSSSFPIPGRPALPTDLTLAVGGDEAIEIAEGLTPFNWRVYNTATLTGPTTAIPTGDGGFIIQEGLMGYMESSELYPDNKPNVYNASANTWSVVTSVPYAGTAISDYDLCGKPIRLHKMPEQRLSANLQHYTASSPNFGGAGAVRIIGTKYENILQPKDNNGNPIPGIVGYRILRGSREGNKTIVAKGMINNMFEYNIEGNITTRKGLYPNYPYNDLGFRMGGDPYISIQDTAEVARQTTGIPNAVVNQETVTFHSPDTTFKEPFLSMKELKVYGQLVGDVHGAFIEPNKHPRHKFITDAAFIISAIAGVGIAALSMNGKRTTTNLLPRKTDFIDMGLVAGASNGTWGLLNGSAGLLVAADAAEAGLTATVDGINAAAWDFGGQLGLNLLGQNTTAYYAAIAAAGLTAGSVPGMTGYTTNIEQEAGAYNNTPDLLTAFNIIPSFAYYWSQGVDTTLSLIQALIKWEQHALQYQSHCFYEFWRNSTIGNTRRLINDEIYLDGQLQDFGTAFRINNLFRGKTVVVQTTSGFPFPAGDTSKQTIGTAVAAGLVGGYSHEDVRVPFATQAVSHYAAMKNRIQNQYGQIGGVQQVPITSCTIDTTAGTFPYASPVLFGGDTYVTRYTEKNTMFFFYDWLYGQPDGYEFNYHLKKMVPYPKYWMDTQRFDTSDFVSSIAANPLSPGSWVFPDKLHAFDRDGTINGLFGVHEAYVYLANSGVRDFYVESDVNTDLRDWGDNTVQRHYDPYRYTDEKAMFDMNPDIIKAGNYFKYDYSLSISKLFPSFISWANVQPINYDPFIYESCYVHYKNRVLYSLPFAAGNQTNSELVKDNWLTFLANNYHDFLMPVTDIKTINKTGALFFFGNQSPLQMVGVENLQVGATEVTIGTGALFSRPLQSLVNADKSFETGSCQGRLSVINTPMGVYWISQSTGNIFQYQLGGGMSEISGTDLNWWFAQYLPCMLAQSFPDFELIDNPVIGVGTQSTFDQQNTIVYFMKRDYKLRDGYVVVTSPSTVLNSIQYLGKNDFLVGGVFPIKLGDPLYFEDASWTASFDPKTKEWVSFHDHHAELCMQGKNTFLTTQTDKGTGQGGLWVHNILCNSYCNFYGADYPFEVEFRVNTGQQVNTLRSIELQMENYLYDAGNCHDRYLMLEYFFDKAVIWNPEQCSGMLKFNPIIHNDPWQELSFPQYNPGSVDILYSKVENKYRFNQMIDLTADRGEFSNARRMIWNTGANGYTRVLNAANLDYAKNPTEHKRFRNYQNSVWMRKDVVGKIKILLILANQKLQQSPR